MEAKHCFTLYISHILNRGHVPHAKQNAIVLDIHALVLERHLLMHKSLFHDTVREGYNGRHWVSPFLCLLSVQAGTILLLYQLKMLLTALALRQFMKSVFTLFFKYFFIHTPAPLMTCKQVF